MDQLIQMSEEEYKTKQDELPDICFVTKCPISDLNKIDLPNLSQIAVENID